MPNPDLAIGPARGLVSRLIYESRHQTNSEKKEHNLDLILLNQEI